MKNAVLPECEHLDQKIGLVRKSVHAADDPAHNRLLIGQIYRLCRKQHPVRVHVAAPLCAASGILIALTRVATQNIFAVTIGAFDPAALPGNLQPDARVTQCAFATVTGDTSGFNNLGFGRFECQGWQSFRGCRSRGHVIGAFMSDEQTGGKAHLADAAVRIEGLHKTYRVGKGQPEKQALNQDVPTLSATSGF